MRTYYLFLIKKDVYDLTKNSPLDLYLSFEKIYKMDKTNVNVGYSIYKKIANKIDKSKISKMIFNINENNVNYTTYKNNHIINDFYNDENTKLTINNSYILIRSNKSIPSFFNDIKTVDNLFVVDFDAEDYFYLERAFVKA